MTPPRPQERFAKVIVDVPSRTVDKPFDYRVPPELAPDTRVGSMVAVPFGTSRRVGYVVDIVDSTDLAKVSEIDAVLETGPVFDEHVLELCRWIGDYYLTSVGEALRLAVPPGRGRRLVRTYRLAKVPTGDRRAVGAKEAPLDDDETAVVEMLRRTGSSSASAVVSATGASGKRALASLVRGGFVEAFYETSRPTAREATVDYARITCDARTAAGEVCRAPKQGRIVALLAEFDSMPVRTLLAESGASRAVLRALVARGIVEIEAHATPRRVDGSLHGEVATPPKRLTRAQKSALEAIDAAGGRHARFLLDGVTGSGKTEVYIRAVQHQLEAGRGAIILVPEISLTPQAVSRFRERLGEQVAVVHSGLSLGERYDQWMAVRSGTHRVVVGARSAVFAPVADLGIIIVDEEQDSSYKQNSSPRYHARDVAIKRAELCGCPVVLGSATPSLESRHDVKQRTTAHLCLPGRVEGRPMPEVQVVDMREEFAAGNWSIFSEPLQQAMADALDAGEKVILFVNRRGFSSFLLCRECGYVPRCANCAVALVYHDRGRQLRCHHCDFAQDAPEVCPSCGSVYLRHYGVGTQRVEDEVRERHSDVPVVRMDADTTKGRNSHARRLSEFARASGAVLLGTQMVAKGHDFPQVTVVGVVNADTALGLPDFRSAERTFQLLVQVSGRAGRGAAPGRVFVQTYWPDHYAVTAVADGDHEQFYQQEMGIRRQMEYPPFVPLVNIGFSGTDAQAVKLAALAASKLVEDFGSHVATVMGPAPAPLERLAGRHRWHLALKLHDQSAAKEALRGALAKLESHRRRGVTITIDVDPVSML
ncbi:MAG: primosomal protein N' [Actinobacteria bacterium]|nr:MAG: primosomal protein N' [Actinomycetota bacterium]